MCHLKGRCTSIARPSTTSTRPRLPPFRFCSVYRVNRVRAVPVQRGRLCEVEVDVVVETLVVLLVLLVYACDGIQLVAREEKRL